MAIVPKTTASLDSARPAMIIATTTMGASRAGRHQGCMKQPGDPDIHANSYKNAASMKTYRFAR